MLAYKCSSLDLQNFSVQVPDPDLLEEAKQPEDQVAPRNQVNQKLENLA